MKTESEQAAPVAGSDEGYQRAWADGVRHAANLCLTARIPDDEMSKSHGANEAFDRGYNIACNTLHKGLNKVADEGPVTP